MTRQADSRGLPLALIPGDSRLLGEHTTNSIDRRRTPGAWEGLTGHQENPDPSPPLASNNDWPKSNARSYAHYALAMTDLSFSSDALSHKAETLLFARASKPSVELNLANQFPTLSCFITENDKYKLFWKSLF